jgi:hypothetical protein
VRSVTCSCSWVVPLAPPIGKKAPEEPLPFVTSPKQGHAAPRASTFGWLMRYRRLARDYERILEHHEAMIYWATVFIMTKRLTRYETGQPQPARWGGERTRPAQQAAYQQALSRLSSSPAASRTRTTIMQRRPCGRAPDSGLGRPCDDVPVRSTAVGTVLQACPPRRDSSAKPEPEDLCAPSHQK